MKNALFFISCLIVMIPLSTAFDTSVLEKEDIPISYLEQKGTVFHLDENVDGVVTPIDVKGSATHPGYAYSYKQANINNASILNAVRTKDLNISLGGPLGLQLPFEVAVSLTGELAQDQHWKHTTNALQGRYKSEESLNVGTLKTLTGDVYPIPLTRMLNAAGYLKVDNAPIIVSQIRSRNNLTYFGKEINDIESSSNSVTAKAAASASLTFLGLGPIGPKTIDTFEKTLLDKGQKQSANAEFLYNTELTKESDSYLKLGVFYSTDSLLWPSYSNVSVQSGLDYSLSSRSIGVADISYAQSQIPTSTNKQHPMPVNEGRDRYVGAFNLTKKIHMNSIVSEWSSADGNTYDWLPCSCNAGWDDMVIHDTRYHSAKGFFDCTSCRPPAPCPK
jgi:hypothetical protein